MKRLAVLAVLLTFCMSLMPEIADAKRLGGSRSLGMQRSIPTQKAAPASQPAAPQQAGPQQGNAAQQPANPAAQPAQAPNQPASQARGSSWMGPLAGLAAGLGLAALASHFGFGEALANGMMIALLVVLGIVVFGWLIRRVLPSPTPATAGGPAYQRSRMDVARDTWQPAQAPVSAGNSRAVADVHAAVEDASAQSAPTAGQPLSLPAGFDAEAFVRQAKVNFVRLQAANDEGNLDDLREFTTPEIYAELKLDIDARRGASQKTEVIDLEAAIVDYAEESNRWLVSVRYTGRLYEDTGVVASDLDEVWHLAKPKSGKTGWLVAGIQQVT